MNSTTKACVAFLICGLVALPAAAQSLGVYPVEELGIVDQNDLEVDVNLEGTTLQIAAGALQDEDPRLVELVSNLTRVRVMVGSAGALSPAEINERIAAAVAQLESRGWTRVMRVEEDESQIHVYSLDGGDGTVAGLTVLVADEDDEAVVANIAGTIDPVLLGSVLGRLGQLDLDELMEAAEQDD